MNHYDTLGVDKSASPDDIKKAFRKAAKDHHPDREQGNPEKMAMINKAYEVLSTPDKREQYDRTGTDAAPQSIEFQARDMLLQMISKIIEGEAVVILPNLRNMVSMNKRGIEQNRIQFTDRIAKLKKKRGKVRVKSGDDLVEMLLSEQIRKCEQSLEQMAMATRITECAEEMLTHWEEDAPPPNPDPWSSFAQAAASQYPNMGFR